MPKVQSKRHNRTAADKRWHNAVASLGSIVSGGPAVLHHAVGATAKHNKQDIGEKWVIPLTNDEHLALHAGETFGHDSRKEFEKQAFKDVVEALKFRRDIKLTDFPDWNVEQAIAGYHR